MERKFMYETTRTRTRPTLLERGGHYNEQQATACHTRTPAAEKQTTVSGASSRTARMLKAIILIGGPMKGRLSDVRNVDFPCLSIL